MITIPEIMQAHGEGYLSKPQATEAIRLLVERDIGRPLPMDGGGTPSPESPPVPTEPPSGLDSPVAVAAMEHAREIEEDRTARIARTVPAFPGKRLLAKRHYKQNEPPVPSRHYDTNPQT